MAQGPAAGRALDDGVRIDEHAVEIEEEGRTTELHVP